MDRREDLVACRTAVISRLLWRVHELDPSHAPRPGSVILHKHQQALRDWLATQPGLVAELARDELADSIALTQQIEVLKRRIALRVREVNPLLLNIAGCAELTAAKLIGETAGVSRFRSEAAAARHAGVTPIPHWSGRSHVRVRGARSGNRQLNAALYRIAMFQIRRKDPSDAYYRQRREAGDSHAEAMRRVQRRLARKVFTQLCKDDLGRAAAPTTASAGRHVIPDEGASFYLSIGAPARAIDLAAEQ